MKNLAADLPAAERRIPPSAERLVGRCLFFIEPATRSVMAAPINAGDAIEAGAPAALFTLEYTSRLISQYPYDVSPDGQRFLIIAPDAATAVTPITLLLNWAGPGN